jgi:hypothetical protein
MVMRARALLIIVALVLCAGCGTTGGGEPSGSGDGKGSTTTTAPDGTDPTTTDTTEPDDGPIASIDAEDLERVLPEATDLPEGYAEVPVPEDDDVETEYEPTIGCEAMAEWLGRDVEDEKTFAQRSFEGPNGFGVNISVTNAPDELKELFADIGTESKECQRIRATSDDGYAADAFMAPGPIDFGDDAFVVDMHVAADGVTFPPTGITLIGVLHGDVTFRVQVVDGIGEGETRVTRDPMLARAIATQMDEDLNLLLGD